MKKNQDRIQYKTRGFKPKKSVIIISLVLIFAVAIAAGFLYYKSLSRFKFEESAEYFINGCAYEIAAGSTAVIAEDGTVQLDDEDSTSLSIFSLPVYFKDRDAVLTVKPMSYFKDGIAGYTRGTQLEVFTELEMRSSNVVISKGIKDTITTGLFAYDGEDSYLLLSEAELTVGEQTVTLSPLSYVVASYGSWVIYYNHETDTSEYIVFEPEEYSEITLSFNNGARVFCDLDRAEAGGENFMLTPAITMLPKTL